MKHLLLVFGLLLIQVAHAQVPVPSAVVASNTPTYCMLLVGTSYTSAYISLFLDYGQDQRGVSPVKDADLARLAEQIKRYTSIPAALSYLATQGWEYVQATTLTVPHETSSNYQGGQVGYLLRRRP